MLYEDNQSAISLAKSPQFHGRAKHIDIRHHFLRERVADGTVELKYCPSENMVADILTNTVKFEKLRLMAGLTVIPTHFTRK